MQNKNVHKWKYRFSHYEIISLEAIERLKLPIVMKLISREMVFYNIARMLALYNSYWATVNKIFIYARLCVNKITWAFFYLASEFPSC